MMTINVKPDPVFIVLFIFLDFEFVSDHVIPGPFHDREFEFRIYFQVYLPSDPTQLYRSFIME